MMMMMDDRREKLFLSDFFASFHRVLYLLVVKKKLSFQD